MLLLRNGEVLRGRVTWAGDHYFVASDGQSIGVRAGDVQFCCRDLDEGYRRKRAGMRAGNVRDHQALARWCMRHRLPGSAALELAAALARDPRNGETELLLRRLESLRWQMAEDREEATKGAGDDSTANSKRQASGTRPSGAALSKTSKPAPPDPFDPAPFNRRFFPSPQRPPQTDSRLPIAAKSDRPR